jgi:hypothetical protein
MTQDLEMRENLRRHVIISADRMVEEAIEKFGPMKLEMSLQDEIHFHIALILLNRVMLRRYGFVPSLLRDSL